MSRSLACCLVALLALSSPLAGQSVVNVGERVRVTTPAQRGAYRYVGRVTDVTHDSLTLQTHDAGTRSVAMADITMLEVSRGKSGNARRGMLYGTAIGVVGGAVLGGATYKKPDCTGFFCPTGRGVDVTAGAILGGAIGFAAGGLWGATHPSERWGRRVLNTVGVAPIAGGHGLTISARF